MIQQTGKGKAAELYSKLERYREPFLQRARANSELTIPGLIPKGGHSGSSPLPQPYQSVGARGVNNLASKLSITSYPPNRRMFRLRLNADLKRETAAEEQSELENAFVELEKDVVVRMERMGVREADYEAKKHLIVAGNALKYYDFKNNNIRVFPLFQYVVRRDTEGRLIELVVKEMVDPLMLPADAPKGQPGNLSGINSTIGEINAKDEDVELYTHVYREKTSAGKWKWCVYQEVYGQVIPSSKGDYGERLCPWVPIRWSRIDGEDYGRSLCDECYGDLKASETLSRALTKSAAVGARTIWMVRRGSGVSLKDLTEAPEGAFVYGSPDDVKPLEASSKVADFNVAKATLDDIIRRLSHWFLLNSAVQRNGERVTAEEIRFMVGELQDALGGVYGVLTKEDLQPTVELTLEAMRIEGLLPKVVLDSTQPIIITGVDALGRSHEAQQLDEFLVRMQAIVGPEGIMSVIKVDELARRMAAGSDVDPKGLVKTPEELAAEQQQANAMQMTEKLGPQAIKAMSDQSIAAAQTGAA